MPYFHIYKLSGSLRFMEPDKETLIDSLYKVMCSSTSTAADARVSNNDYFKRRVLGFRAEIGFENELNNFQELSFLEGGQLISTKLSGLSDDRNNFIYVTLSTDAEAGYKNIYKIISDWPEVEELIYIKILPSEWETETFQIREVASGPKIERSIYKPNYEFYTYNKISDLFELYRPNDFSCILNRFETATRSPSIYPLRKRDQFDYFNDYDLNVLKKIYANRYFLDLIMRKARGRQIIDLDGIIDNGDSLTVVEIKEKSPIKKDEQDSNTWQYGWDSRRILWYLYLQNKIQLKVLYNVRQIDNREERNFIQWDSIYMDEFLEGVSWSNSRSGGGGEDTLLAPYSFFTRLESKLRNL